MRSARLWTVLLVATLVSGYAPAQTSTQATRQTSKKTRVKKESATEIELRELREQMQAQQDEIDALKQQLSTRDQQVSQAQQAASTAQSQAATATTAANQAQKTANAGLQETVVNNQAAVKSEIENPLAVHYKGLNITPVAFFAFEGVWRQHTLNSDINTPMNSIPFPSASEYPATELNFSARQSRLGALIEGNTGKLKLTGYAEMDFLGTGTSSNNNQSNS